MHVARRPVVVLAAVCAAAAVAAGSAGACTLLSASTGPVDVNAAGLVTLHLDPIALDLELTGLPGTVLCPILGGTTTGTTPVGG